MSKVEAAMGRGDWLEANRLAEECPRCHGEGEITVNTSWVKCGPDPQLDREERCPDCHGTGEATGDG